MGKRITFDPYEHFMLRAPLLPVGFLATIPDSPQKLYHWLKELWKDEVIREGLLLGSYEFSLRLDQEFNPSKTSAPDNGVMFSFLRYLCRFASRCTPFGTFAGFTTGQIGDETAVMLGDKRDHQIHARPDMEYLMRIARLLESDADIREKLIFTANSTLYCVGSRWHYVEVRIPEGKPGKQYDIVTIDDNGVIRKILEFCTAGKSLPEIRNFLIMEGWDKQEVHDFVDSLVDSQVIVSGLEPVICGPEYLECLLSQLTFHGKNHEVVQSLVALRDTFSRMNKPSDVHTSFPLLDPILAAIPVPVNRNHLVQVDMKLSSRAMIIDNQLTNRILLGLRILKALSPVSRMDLMKGFREAFSTRYDSRKVQLVKVLDPETGIGLEGSVEGYWTDPVPWIDDLRWGPSFGSVNVQENSGNAWLSGKFNEAAKDERQYIDLESSDLQSIGIHEGSWPNQMMAMVEFFEPDIPGELNIHFVLGSSGNPSYLLGRFGFADQDGTRVWINELIKDETAFFPEALCAEVVHLPEDRTGNVLQRPAFLEYEIPYLARSDKSRDRQIPVTDIMVSVENHEVILTSAKSGRQIRPFMSNAYNHQLGNLAVYKFLHRIHLQDYNRSYQPDWSDSALRAAFIPGIRFKNLILSHPVWLIRCEELTRWIHSGRNDLELQEVINWKNSRHMPDEMLWISSDQELYFNWTNASLVLALWDTVGKLTSIKVRPFYLSAGTPVKSPDGSHANQFIFCYRKT